MAHVRTPSLNASLASKSGAGKPILKPMFLFSFYIPVLSWLFIVLDGGLFLCLGVCGNEICF